MTEEKVTNTLYPSPLTPAELTEHFYNSSTEELSALGKKVCTEVHGKAVLIRGLLEYTNYCVSNCLYCGIRRDNRM